MTKDSEIPKFRWVREHAETPKVEVTKDPQVIDKATFRELTGVVLESNGVPRDYLFEYPYNEFESRKLIAKAEATVGKIADILKMRIER